LNYVKLNIPHVLLEELLEIIDVYLCDEITVVLILDKAKSIIELSYILLR
jgi:hypothetical protein